MVTVPALTPVTPPVEVTVAVDVLLLLHEPPDVASLNVVDAPEQIAEVPVIAETTLTVTVWYA